MFLTYDKWADIHILLVKFKIHSVYFFKAQ